MTDPEVASKIGKLQRVSLRTVWRHEARDLTTWLELNPDVLSDVLGFSLESVERERAAGAFSVDLLAEDESGHSVVIENQLERSDHDHLGKLVTYAASFEARAAVWIVADPRPEHVGAITWLNESLATDFYFVKVEGVQIGNSEPAALLTLITGPSLEARSVGVQKQERAERHELREAFWKGLLERARGKSALHSAVSPGSDSWLSAGSGRSGIHYTYVVHQHDVAVQLVIEGSDAEQNVAIFDALFLEREAIDEAFGAPLDWSKVEGRKRCFLSRVVGTAGYKNDPSEWAATQDLMIDAMVRLEAAVAQRLAALRVPS